MSLSFGSLFRSLDRVCGLTAVYTPKGGTAVDVVIVPGRDSQDATPNRVVRAGQRSQDWLLSLSQYAPDPQVGDTVRVFYENRETTWEVRSLGQSLPWDWSDRLKLRRRLHTVEILPEGET